MAIRSFVHEAAVLSAHAFFTGAICIALTASSLHAQVSGVLTGRVVAAESRSPVVAALIILDGARPVQTDLEGRYRIEGVGAGTHTVEARRVGFTAQIRSVDLSAGDSATVDFTLVEAPSALGTVTVIGTRTDLDETRERIAAIPGAVALVGPEEIRSTRQANLKDVLQFTPGVYVQSRFGAADEAQISIRGSGLRNNFHARGVNLLVNGMPYRNTDGFTDFESLELLNTESIEVYKGGNALRYGGSTLGGAINLETKTGYTATPVGVTAEGGSFGFLKTQLSSGATVGNLDYFGSYTRTTLDGFRDYAVQGRARVNGHLGYVLSDNTDIRG